MQHTHCEILYLHSLRHSQHFAGGANVLQAPHGEADRLRLRIQPIIVTGNAKLSLRLHGAASTEVLRGQVGQGNASLEPACEIGLLQAFDANPGQVHFRFSGGESRPRYAHAVTVHLSRAVHIHIQSRIALQLPMHGRRGKRCRVARAHGNENQTGIHLVGAEIPRKVDARLAGAVRQQNAIGCGKECHLQRQQVPGCRLRRGCGAGKVCGSIGRNHEMNLGPGGFDGGDIEIPAQK